MASNPLIRGIRTSIRTTSGSSAATMLDGGLTVGCVADHDDVGFGLQDHPQSGAHEVLVVGDDDADHWVVPIGSRARTVYPFVSCPAVREPP